jgi:Protein of unknown function (DUF3667)
MSHGNERKERVCLNCNARVFGPYCHVCGQHNIEPKETAIGLIVHFFNDITHFEGKFITSLRYLLFRPGFLTKEYERGRRASYMNPVRMYVFASAFFFILFFSFFSDTKDVIKIKETPSDTVSKNKPVLTPKKLREEALKDAKTKEDSAAITKVFSFAGNSDSAYKKDSVTSKGIGMFGIMGTYTSIASYDSAQKALPKEKRDNWLEQSLTKRAIVVNEKYDGDIKKFNAAVFDHAIHSLPKLLFISLPIFAFLLFILYARHKRYYYVVHVILTIHFYVYIFLMLLLIFTNDKIGAALSWWPRGLLAFAAWVYIFIYLYKAMRRVYEQRRFKTMVKYFILLFCIAILYAVLFTALFSYSLFNV